MYAYAGFHSYSFVCASGNVPGILEVMAMEAEGKAPLVLPQRIHSSKSEEQVHVTIVTRLVQ